MSLLIHPTDPLVQRVESTAMMREQQQQTQDGHNQYHSSSHLLSSSSMSIFARMRLDIESKVNYTWITIPWIHVSWSNQQHPISINRLVRGSSSIALKNNC